MPWIHKKIGLAVLGERGTRASLDLLNRYAADETSYVRHDLDGSDPRTISFREDAERARRAILAR